MNDLIPDARQLALLRPTATPAGQTAGPAPLRAEIRTGDCRALLPELADNSAQLAITDPPYFLNGLDDRWRKGDPERFTPTSAGGGMPPGMAFDKRQGARLQEFLTPVFGELARVLTPGGFALCFSQPRLAHRAAVAAEDAGFEIRDALVWHRVGRNKAKAFGMDYLIDRNYADPGERARLKALVGGRKTPQLRPEFESIILAQKPREGTFVENWAAWGVGLIDAGVQLRGRTPGTVLTVEKPPRDDRHGHLTPKPTPLLEYLVQVFSAPGQTVLDPFAGTGSTGVAALSCGRHAVLMEINPDYAATATQRLLDAAARPETAVDWNISLTPHRCPTDKFPILQSLR